MRIALRLADRAVAVAERDAHAAIADAGMIGDRTAVKRQPLSRDVAERERFGKFAYRRRAPP